MRILEFGLKYVKKEYLLSPEYDEFMHTFLTNGEDRYDLGEDLHPNKSYGWRHLNMTHVYVWRWLSIYQHRHELIDYVFSDKVGIDLGGANGPIGGNSRIIDIQPGFDRLEEVEDNSLDYIFTSHCLEHIPNLDEKLIELRSKLKDGGVMIGVVPCYKCVRWRHTAFNDHRWTFSLEDDEWTKFDDKILKAGFKIKEMEYSWENAIWFVCEKQ